MQIWGLAPTTCLKSTMLRPLPCRKSPNLREIHPFHSPQARCCSPLNFFPAPHVHLPRSNSLFLIFSEELADPAVLDPLGMSLAQLDPLGVASLTLPAASKLPPVHLASVSRNRNSADDFVDESSAGIVRLSTSSRRKGGLRAQKESDQLDVEPQASEGHRRCLWQCTVPAAFPRVHHLHLTAAFPSPLENQSLHARHLLPRPNLEPVLLLCHLLFTV